MLFPVKPIALALSLAMGTAVADVTFNENMGNAPVPSSSVTSPDISGVIDEAKRFTEQMNSSIEQGMKRVDRSTVSNPLMRASGIADEKLAQHREAMLNALGLSDYEGRIYIFVSLSMPDELIRAYAEDAHKIGGILVVKGITEGSSLPQFLKTQLTRYISPVGREAAIQIDPRLFDSFKVDAVPSIVFTNQPSLDLCGQQIQVNGMYQGDTYSYDACKALKEDSYWKLSGAVTTLWALQQMKEVGAPVEKQIALFKNDGLSPEGVEKPNKQVGITPEAWRTATDSAIQESVKGMLERYGGAGGTPVMTPYGLGVQFPSFSQ